MSAIELVLPCTKRKQVDVPSHLHFRALPRMPAHGLADLWASRLEGAPDRRTVAEMYSGGGWTAVLQARAAAQAQGGVRLHILSAGLGLVTEDELFPAYSATFAAALDQVASRLEGGSETGVLHQEWWGAINGRRDVGEAPLARRLSGSERIVVAAGADYLIAVHRDLEALAVAAGPERLFVISAGTQPDSLAAAVRRCFLPVRVDMQLVYGGTRSTLNVWAAKWLLERAEVVGWDRTRIEQEITNAIAARRAAGAHLPGVGQRHTDAEVRAWIDAYLQQEPETTATSLLARFRSEGRACLDTRFRRLLREIRRDQLKGPVA
jgi:hypothetical protein